MNPTTPKRSVWGFARAQHGVITSGQLAGLGLSHSAIGHRVRTGRLHRIHRGIYAVGRPGLTRHGRWMAAVLVCGRGAALSHHSAAAHWEIREDRLNEIHVSAPTDRRPPAIVVHLRQVETSRHRGIPVTSLALTLVDLAATIPRGELESAMGEADRRGLTDPPAIRLALGRLGGRPGVAVLRSTLDRQDFRLTDSALERRFLAVVRAAGLPTPETGRWLNGFKTDLYWPQLGLVVETDGLRYHRTPAQQARDRLRDQAHARAGLTALRFTHAQVTFDPGQVRDTLTGVMARLAAAARPG
ncbi:MAG: type IV toxin-antitoxin system AbiEi family antitoxin domain-containing protein [Thermoleophilaceae bacterium]|nr:type IV toxin-antitoxin system AbiEi family antitoxin domain-containing protein [Thermoleophilaceae bacterium]